LGQKKRNSHASLENIEFRIERTQPDGSGEVISGDVEIAPIKPQPAAAA
jgi:hypothetical protein